MYVHIGQFTPKVGHEEAFFDFFTNRVLPITLSADGLLAADVVALNDGRISNLERWESKDHWAANNKSITEKADAESLLRQHEELVESGFESPCQEVAVIRD